MNKQIRVTVQMIVDASSAHDILAKFEQTGLECSVTFDFPPQPQAKIESDVIQQQPVNNMVGLVSGEDTAPPIDLDAETLIRKNKAEAMGLKLGCPCYVPSIVSSQGSLIHISEDYSMFLIKMAPTSTAGSQVNSHDVTMFPVKLGDKVKWTELEDIAYGVMPSK